MRILMLFLIAAMALFVQPFHVAGQESGFPPVAGWRLTQEETVYTPNNLYDVIDGAADLFLEYNFVDLHIGRYAQGELEIKVELYKHGSSDDAFGIFSQERFADYHFIDLGVQGYLEKGALNFLSGVYYVKISTIQEGNAAQSAMLLVAKAINKHLQQSSSWPPLLAAFPSAGRKGFSEQYVAKSFLGYSSLNAAFVASYDSGTSFKAFVMKFETPQEALNSLRSFMKALPEGATKKETDGKLEIRDPNSGWLEVVHRRNFLYGVVSPEVVKGHNSFLDQFGKNLLTIQ